MRLDNPGDEDLYFAMSAQDWEDVEAIYLEAFDDDYDRPHFSYESSNIYGYYT